MAGIGWYHARASIENGFNQETARQLMVRACAAAATQIYARRIIIDVYLFLIFYFSLESAWNIGTSENIPGLLILFIFLKEEFIHAFYTRSLDKKTSIINLPPVISIVSPRVFAFYIIIFISKCHSSALNPSFPRPKGEKPFLFPSPLRPCTTVAPSKRHARTASISQRSCSVENAC